MSYWFEKEKIRLTEEQDRRIKLTKEQKEIIKREYATGLFSLNNLAKKYHVCKKTILLIVNQESLERSREYCKEYSKTHRNKYDHNRAMRRTRYYKSKILKKNNYVKEK